MTQSGVVIEKEVDAATRSNATTSLNHGFINSLQPCLLASSKPLPIMSLTPFAKCVNHGFATYISLEDVQNSENYTRVVIHSHRYRVIHSFLCSNKIKNHNVNINIRMLEDANVNIPILDLVPIEEIEIDMIEDANVNVLILDLVPTEETEIDMIEDDNGVSGGCWIQLTIHVHAYIFMTIRTDRDRDI
ncbi:hypothetical protein RDI58_007233 [Solanum bulbocastanum]|uniref:Uncharacterized protein n=1 Tax=Solanum bulbocastanum TaxID=147425 RepID=A0AAN8YIE8_SOLBU